MSKNEGYNRDQGLVEGRLSRRQFLRYAGFAAAGATVAACGEHTLSARGALPFPAPGIAYAAGRVLNLSNSFYERDGLEGMPRIDYESMPVVNVRDYGATGDGQHSDTEAFDKAVDALSTQGGGVVYVPKGIYLFGAPKPPYPHHWLKSLKNIHFIGEGESSIILFELPGIPRDGDQDPKYTYMTGWNFPEADNVSLRSLSLTVAPYFMMRSLLPIYTLLMSGGDGVQIVDVRMDQGQPGMWIPEGRNKWVVNCVVRNTSSDGIHFECGRDSVAAYNYIENANDDSIANFTNTANCPDTRTVANVRFVHNTALFSGWGRGMTLGGTNHTIANNWIEAIDSAGIYSDVGLFGGAAVGTLYNAAVKNNTLVRNELAERADNDFYKHGTGGYQGNLSFRDKADGVVIEGNRLYGAQANGITFGIEDWRPFEGKNISISNNEIARQFNVAGSYHEYNDGIRFIETATVDGISIEDNKILDNEGISVRVQGALSDARTSGNHVSKEPVVEGAVSGDVSGFQVVSDKSEYEDVYREMELADDETGWLEPPTASKQDALLGRRHVANVRAFGARGNGHANDLPAFYRALDSLPKEGGVIKVPAGTYRLSPLPDRESYPWTRIRHHLLIANRNNVHIEGVGDESRLLFTSPDHQGLRFLNVKQSSVRKLKLELDKQPPLRHNRALLDLSAAQATVVEEVSAESSSGPGILVDSSRHMLVKSAQVINSGTHGISIGSSRQVTIEDCDVRNSRDNGIHLTWIGNIDREPQYIRVEDNRISGTREGAGIGIEGGDHVQVTQNEVSDSYLAGIYVYKRSPNFPHNHIEITDNTLRDANSGRLTYTPGAISVHNLQRGRESGDLLIASNAVSDTRFSGIWVGGVTPFSRGQYSELERLVLRGNLFRNVGGEPIDISEEQRGRINELILE